MSEQIKGKTIIYSGGNTKDGGLCTWCREPVKKGEGVELPVKGSYKIKTKTYMYECFDVPFDCCECAYAFLLMIKARNPESFSNSENLLLDLYDKSYPGKKLIPANDYWLKTEFSGPLDSLTYKKTRYISNGNRIMLPMLNEYNWRD